MKLTDPQSEILNQLFESQSPDDGRGRPRVEARPILDGILWILKTGAQWEDLPPRYPSKATCHRRFQEWVEDGTLEVALCTLAEDLTARGGLDVREAYVDGTFSSAKKEVSALARPSAGRVASSWRAQTAMVFLSEYGLAVLRRLK